MRRYGDTTPVLTVPGQDAGLKLTLQPAVEPARPCRPAPAGLAWFSDASADFTEISEAAYLLPNEPIGPLLALARVLGETCGEVKWSTEWTPAAGTGGAPEAVGVGADLLVYPAIGGGPGQLSVSADCGGQSLGSILLTLLAAPAGGGSECCPEPAARPPSWGQYGDKLAYLFEIGGTNLKAELDGEIISIWSVSYTGDDPGPLALTSGHLAAMLFVNEYVQRLGLTTQITVAAELGWTCADGWHTATLTWDLSFSGVGGG